MGIFGSTVSYLRFRVSGPIPQNFAAVFEQALSIRRFVPLRPEGEDMESAGFAPVNKPYDDTLPLLTEQFLFDNQILLAYREDTIMLPSAQLKELVEQRLAEQKEKTGRDSSASLRKNIEAAVRSELRAKVFPKSKVVDVSFDIDKKEVRFFALGKSVAERFVKLFEHTFETKLFSMGFANQALHFELQPREKALLEMARPTEIFPSKQRIEEAL